MLPCALRKRYRFAGLIGDRIHLFLLLIDNLSFNEAGKISHYDKISRADRNSCLTRNLYS